MGYSTCTWSPHNHFPWDQSIGRALRATTYPWWSWRAQSWVQIREICPFSRILHYQFIELLLRAMALGGDGPRFLKKQQLVATICAKVLYWLCLHFFFIWRYMDERWFVIMLQCWFQTVEDSSHAYVTTTAAFLRNIDWFLHLYISDTGRVSPLLSIYSFAAACDEPPNSHAAMGSHRVTIHPETIIRRTYRCSMPPQSTHGKIMLNCSHLSLPNGMNIFRITCFHPALLFT